MNNKINHLNTEERNLIFDAPIYVSALISGVDGDFHAEEIAKAVKIIHIKSYSETREVRGVYQSIEEHSEEKIDALIASLPTSTSDRNEFIIEKLSHLNAIFEQLEPQFAYDLYKSLKELAYYVSVAATSGLGFQNELEKEMSKLPFLKEPIVE